MIGLTLLGISLGSGSGARVGRTFYVTNSGSDSAAGTSPSTAWQTTAHVATQTFIAGDTVLFQGGQTFSGKLSLGTSNYSVISPPSKGSPLTIGSFGGGRATITPAANNDCLDTLNIGNITIRDLILQGPSNLYSSNTGSGLLVSNTVASSQLSNVNIINVLATENGASGIHVFGNATSAGFSDVLISNCVATINGGLGIQTHAVTPNSHNRVTVTGCVASLNSGNQGGTTGSGIVLGGVDVGAVTLCHAFSNGASAPSSPSGPVGIWTYESTSVVISFCESDHNTALGSDGDGFDIDETCLSCIIEYCYSHNNKGAGYLIDNGAAVASNGIVRYCISENDASNNSGGVYGSITVAKLSSATFSAQVYGNTIYQSQSGCYCLVLGDGTYGAATTGNIANNIFYAASGAKLVNSFLNPTGMLLQGNTYFAAGTFVINWNGTTYNSFASWQTAIGQEKLGGVNVGQINDPLLTSPGTGGTLCGTGAATTALLQGMTAYQLQSFSPASGTGLTPSQLSISSFGTQDYYGVPVPNAGNGSGYNMGASNAVVAAGVVAATGTFTLTGEAATFGNPITVPSGLTHYWPMNSGSPFADVIGSNTMSDGGVASTGVTGQIAQGLHLNGNGSSTISDLELGSIAVNGAFSYSVWIKPDSLATQMQLFMAASPGDLAKYDAVFANGSLYISIYDSGGNDDIALSSNAGAIVAGSWQHLVCTYDGGTSSAGMAIYVNGSAISASDSSGGTFTAPNPTAQASAFGNYPAVSPHYAAAKDFLGAVDDLRTYNRVLSSSEVTAIYTAGQSGNP
jgi:Concanavalin A-like lectin/glucanases superfamily